MKLESLTILFTETCRHCGDEHRYQHVLEDLPEPDDPQVEMTVHERLEAEGWTDGLCPECAGRVFLDEGDRADHELKIEKELR